VLLLTLVGDWRQEGAVRTAGASILGVAYVAMFSLMVPISRGSGSMSGVEGCKLLATALVMVWLIDTLAYFGGSTLGAHRLAPNVSPNKSWEGAAFGFVGALAGAGFGKWVFAIEAMSLTELLAFAAAIGVLSQVGDLVESMMKRDVGVKDASGLVPGHGGVLDRFDSFLFALPVTWCWITIRSLVAGG